MVIAGQGLAILAGEAGNRMVVRVEQLATRLVKRNESMASSIFGECVVSCIASPVVV